MKTITIIILIITIFTHQKSNALCEAYITDEWPNSRYTVKTILGDNVVTDNITGLMWKQCSEGLADTSCNTGTLLSYTWKEALDLSEALNNNLGFAGYNDWRVPNITELRSIAVINCSNPAINETVFPNTPSSWFWSSSPNVNSNRTWTVDFVSGIGNSDTRDDNGHVRLVRSGH